MKPIVDNKSLRDSNMELLRIFAMFLIMVLHADFASLSAPSISDCQSFPISSFMRFFIEGLSVVAVNAFVILSGWYGIKPSIKKLSSFIFQALFIVFLIYLFFFLIGKAPYHNLAAWLKIAFFQQYWFVQSYIILYVFTPVLNSFVEISNEKSFRMGLVSLFLVQELFGFFPYANTFGWFQTGYSPLSFFFLYLLARYVRIYAAGLMIKTASYYLCGWLLCALLAAIIAMSSSLLGYGADVLLYVYGYTSPITIIGAIMLVVAFSRITLTNNWINWIAKSSFAVYIVHCHECIFVPEYCSSIRLWFETDNVCMFLIKTGLIIIVLYTISIFIDKIRIKIWDLILHIFRF